MIRYANTSDLDILNKYDKHISKEELENAINLNRIFFIYQFSCRIQLCIC